MPFDDRTSEPEANKQKKKKKQKGQKKKKGKGKGARESDSDGGLALPRSAPSFETEEVGGNGDEARYINVAL